MSFTILHRLSDLTVLFFLLEVVKHKKGLYMKYYTFILIIIDSFKLINIDSLKIFILFYLVKLN